MYYVHVMSHACACANGMLSSSPDFSEFKNKLRRSQEEASARTMTAPSPPLEPNVVKQFYAPFKKDCGEHWTVGGIEDWGGGGGGGGH